MLRSRATGSGDISTSAQEIIESYTTFVLIFRRRRSAPTEFSSRLPLAQICATRPCHDHATPLLTSLRLPALPRPRLGVNELGMSTATILESGVVIRFEVFELQRLKVDQFFRGFFRDFPTLITLTEMNKYRNEAFIISQLK